MVGVELHRHLGRYRIGQGEHLPQSADERVAERVAQRFRPQELQARLDAARAGRLEHRAEPLHAAGEIVIPLPLVAARPHVVVVALHAGGLRQVHLPLQLLKVGRVLIVRALAHDVDVHRHQRPLQAVIAYSCGGVRGLLGGIDFPQRKGHRVETAGARQRQQRGQGDAPDPALHGIEVDLHYRLRSRWPRRKRTLSATWCSSRPWIRSGPPYPDRANSPR